MTLDYETYLSPFTWRYGSPEMRRLWSEAHKRRLWRQLWVALAEVQAEYGLVTAEQVADLRRHMDEVDMPRALEIEAEIQHDLMAELHAFAEQAPAGRRHPPPGRHLDGYRGQRRCAAHAPVARPGAGRRCAACC